MLSGGIKIYTTDGHSIIDMASGSRINSAEKVVIGDHVWIGADVKILKGVNIGSNSIIASSAVVTRDVPSNSVVAGIPAKVIMHGVNWQRERL
jgi:acetyltransferase-like isoleucine patch superfamily enzyme